jgi:lysophospholipase L1-like esterase
MYRFQVNAHTQTGESIGIVGSTPELGLWDVRRCLHLSTSADRYPLWWADIEIDVHPSGEPSSRQRIEYKYVLLRSDGSVEWESLAPNRWVPVESDRQQSTIIVDDGWFGHVQPCPFGYFEEPPANTPLTKGIQGLKIAVIGSSLALGCNGWLLRGWAWHLEQALHKKYGHQLVNLSEVGANVSTTINRFPVAVAPEKPDVVIISLSLGNEGLAYCPAHQRRAVQRRFESGLQQLIKMTRELGALPILGGVYPNGDYNSEHNWLLRDTHNRMLRWGVPVLDWLDAVDDGEGRWKAGTSFDPAHPNTEGHRLMYEAIDLRLFQMTSDEWAKEKLLPRRKDGRLIYRDKQGFQVFAGTDEKTLRVINASKYTYTIAPYWKSLQAAIQSKAGLMPGIYIARNAQLGTLPFFSVRDDGTIETAVDIPPATDLEYSPAFNFFSPKVSQILFYDGHLGILKENEDFIRAINETDHEYNIHPMWKEVRSALKAMPPGVYDDPLHPEVPFRTMTIGKDGLESRVKVPPKSSVLFQYKCELSELSRVAIVPLGDRCAARMLLYKTEYDGPAFPFDLTRTTNLGDVADMIESDFYDMWNTALLQYSHEAGRIYHTKWTGLSFAHEVEETDDPLNNMFPVYERMRVRYTARSERFWHTLRNADELLFVRTGITNRGYVSDLVSKLSLKCPGKPFRFLLISPQSSEDFSGLPNVLHYELEFNPDRMYEDLGYWMYCTEVMRGILESLGVSSKNLFWCPPNPPKDDRK